MAGTRSILCWALAAAALIGACSKRVSLEESSAPVWEPDKSLSELSVPLDLREFEVVRGDGYRGVFLKLSRLPDSVSHRGETDPARIILDITGPTGGEEPEEIFPAGDTLVSRMRVSRRFGTLRVVFDLQADDLPDYSVHTMADWIMIRLAPARRSRAGPARLHS